MILPTALEMQRIYFTAMGRAGFSLFISLHLTFPINQADLSVQHRDVGKVCNHCYLHSS